MLLRSTLAHCPAVDSTVNGCLDPILPNLHSSASWTISPLSQSAQVIVKGKMRIGLKVQ